MITAVTLKDSKVLTNQFSVTNEYHIKKFSKAFIWIIVTDFHSWVFRPENLTQNSYNSSTSSGVYA